MALYGWLGGLNLLSWTSDGDANHYRAYSIPTQPTPMYFLRWRTFAMADRNPLKPPVPSPLVHCNSLYYDLPQSQIHRLRNIMVC